MDGTVGDHPISGHYPDNILDRIDSMLDDEFRLQIIVDGKGVGYLSNGNDTVETKIRI